MELEKEVKDECVVINEIKKTRGRPKGSFKENKKVVDKDYYKNYYHKTCGDVVCECGLKTNKRNLARHMKTKKHLEILELKNQ